MRVLLVHDRLLVPGGSERVLAALAAIWPDAPIAVVLNDWDRNPPGEPTGLEGRQISSTFLDRIPWLRRRSRAVLPFMPFAVEQIPTAGFDVVISSSHAVAKGIITGPYQLHLCYCHTPMRYAWDLQSTYLDGRGMSWGPLGLTARVFLHRLRAWDVRSANGVDRFIANSRHIARRIRKCYRRHATVIHPPVDIADCPTNEPKEDFWVSASRMVPYKRVDVLVEAFRRTPARRLELIGDGPELPSIRRLAGGAANIIFHGRLPRAAMLERLARAKGFVFAAEEDFGISPVEAMACGTPVVAYGRGGVRDTVIDGVTGAFFTTQSPEAVIAAVEQAERTSFSPAACREAAERLAPERFVSAIRDLTIRCHRAMVRGEDPEVA